MDQSLLRGRAVASKRVIAALVVVLGAASSRPAGATDPNRVEWSDDWPRARLWEIVGATVLTVGDTELEDRVPIPAEARWRGGILFDDWARSVFRGRTAAVQQTASTVSNYFFYAGTLVPFVVDDYFVALDVHRNAEVALQMFVINMQAEGISGLVSLGAEHGVGRARPFTADCGPDGKVRDAAGVIMHACGLPDDNRSFFSGHVAAVSTMAGLTCVHHQHLPLYGGGFADLAPCLVMIGVSAATGVLRLVYDEHWATDVVTGWATGALSGYVIPSILHYGFGSGRPVGEVRAGDLTLVPTLGTYGGRAGVGVVGVF